MSDFDSLPSDVKLHLFSFLKTQDVMKVVAVNHANRALLAKPEFWRQRTRIDFHKNVPAGVAPKNFYMRSCESRKKIRSVFNCGMAVDNAGNVYVIKGTFDPENHTQMQRLLTIQAFARKHKIIDFGAATGGATYLLTASGLFGLGNNYHGQLGVDSEHNAFDKVRCVFPIFNNDKIVKFAYGWNYVVVQTKTQLWMAGDFNDLWQAGRYLRCFDNMDITLLRCGQDSMMLKSGNNLYISGKEIVCTANNANSIQAIYYGSEAKQLLDFKDKNILDFVCEGEHFAVLCRDGLYVAGQNYNGEIGLPEKVIPRFTKVNFFDSKNIQNIYMSACHMLVVCDDGLYVTGMNNVGRLGLGDRESRHQFTRLDIDPSTVTDVQLTIGATFLEINGVWKMAGSFYSVREEDKHNVNFENVEFIPLNSAQFQPAHERVSRSCSIC